MSFQLVVLYGRPGVGKLTIGRHLAERTGFRLFHNHLAFDLALSLFKFGSPEFIELREEVWLSSLTRAASSGLSGVIFTFAPEITVPDVFIPTLQERINGAGGVVSFVELGCAPDELHRRLEQPDRAKYAKLKGIAKYQMAAAQGRFDRPIMPTPDHPVDTTHLSADESAESIAEFLARSAPA
ncbi:AAA family ATPase [Longimicrobium terrae]|uniref:Shikimate kinase n=1 Tax=Longimicrobium terrae TaxID=1639882 RepID=A0A841GS82_9BACT|nr:AAA family ATPase [Longimicrobium terrae]MBB4634794.1 hypothetical protein [Longimicrobium terrae]MBB6069189.1 hypothetical protein [Longimicrobium terrae]NNC31999.1 AAA family ATPase [Longimicrobium terrae]